MPGLRSWFKWALGGSGTRAARLFNDANAASEREEYVTAFGLYEQCLDLMRQLERWEAVLVVRLRLGYVAQAIGDFPAARMHLEQAVSVARNSKARPALGYALVGLAQVAARQGDVALARRLCDDCLLKFVEPEEVHIRAAAYGVLGTTAETIAAARAHHQQALDLYRQYADQAAILSALCSLGHATGPGEDNSLARASLKECLELCEVCGTEKLRSYALNNMGNIERLDGDMEAATELYRQSLHLKQNIGDDWAIAYTLEGVAAIATARGQGEAAARLLGAAHGIRERVGGPLEPPKQPELRATVEAARGLLTPEDFEFYWNCGGCLSVADAASEAARL